MLAQATVVQNILDGSAIRKPGQVSGGCLFIAGALVMGLTRALSFRSQWITALLLGLAIVVSGALLLYYQFLWIEMVLAPGGLCGFVGVSVSTFREASLARARVQGAVDALAEVAGAIAHARNPAELCQALETGIGRVLGAERARSCVSTMPGCASASRLLRHRRRRLLRERATCHFTCVAKRWATSPSGL